MRLVVIGPCDGDVRALARAAHCAVTRLSADRVVYLGSDGALDAVVAGWATLLGVRAPFADRLARVLSGDPERLDRDLEREIAREPLRRKLATIQALPAPGLRSLEIMTDRIVLLIEDKSGLDEEDLLPATAIVFGRGDAMIRKVGTRVFLCPGSCAKPAQGLLLLDDAALSAGIAATLHGPDGTMNTRDIVETTRSVKMKVQGAGG